MAMREESLGRDWLKILITYRSPACHGGGELRNLLALSEETKARRVLGMITHPSKVMA
jgi:hypothetical protein